MATVLTIILFSLAILGVLVSATIFIIGMDDRDGRLCFCGFLLGLIFTLLIVITSISWSETNDINDGLKNDGYHPVSVNSYFDEATIERGNDIYRCKVLLDPLSKTWGIRSKKECKIEGKKKPIHLVDSDHFDGQG